MLRQPQLHSSITRAHMHVCASLPLELYTTHRLGYTHTNNPVVAMGDRGVSARVWHALSQVVQENDDSWQLTVWHPPPLKKFSPTSPCVILPLSLSLHIFTSPFLSLSLPLFLTLFFACWLWSNNSSSTCLDSSTFMKISMWAACFPVYVFVWVSHFEKSSFLCAFFTRV